MLQGKLTKLDSDFITLWSNYAVYSELDKEALRKLAEMGQIDAVAAYYQFFDERNSKVDAIVNGYKGINGDELWAKTRKYSFEHPEEEIEAEKLWDEADKLKEEIDEYNDRHPYSPYDLNYDLHEGRTAVQKDFDEFDERNRKVKRYNSIEHEYKNIPYVKRLQKTIDKYWSAWHETKNPFFGEKAMEIYVKRYFIDIDSARKAVASIRKSLIKVYRKNKKDEAVQFVLGKNLIKFRASDREKAFGTKLLQKLAAREYSQELRAYNEDYTATGDERE